MKQLPLNRGEGPYEISYLVSDPQSNQLQEQSVSFNVRAYGEQEGKPTVFLISENPQNTGGDVSVVTPRIADKLRDSHGYKDMQSLTFFNHYPENGRENGPERYYQADVSYNLNGPYLENTSKDVRPDEVATVIGEENMRVGYLASPPRSANPLVSKAFESGLEDRPEHEQDRTQTIEF
jgi:hypothetical protein